MNFFGHAVVASWWTSEPATILGAMLPDLAGMLRSPPPTPSNTELRRGIALHYATDASFHESRHFRDLQSSAFSELQSLGVRRGSARAVAHVGIELILDGILARGEQATADYRAALHSAPSSQVRRGLAWREPTTHARFVDLCRVLEARAFRAAHFEPDAIAERLWRVLLGRPRLELRDSELPWISDWVARTLPAVEQATDPLLERLREEIAGQWLEISS